MKLQHGAYDGALSRFAVLADGRFSGDVTGLKHRTKALEPREPTNQK
jgi:hypothetical protein